MEEKKYIHYGHKRFNLARFEPVRNGGYCNPKPYGGFWASPVDAKWGWKEWCLDSKFRSYRKGDCFEFTLKSTVNVLRIDSLECLQQLPRRKVGELEEFPWIALDFEKLMADGVDAIEVILSSDYRLYRALYGWDCDSLLVMNPDIIC